MSLLSKRAQSYGFMLVNTFLWSLPFLVVKPALDVTTPNRIMLYRYGLAVICSLPILWYYLGWKKYRLQLAHYVKITLIELLGSVLALALLYSGLKYVGAIEAGLLGASSPILITLGGVLLLKERQEKNESIGLFLAFIGTILLIFNPVLSFGESIGSISLLGSGLIIGSHVLNMFYFPLMKKYYHGLPKLLVATIGFYVAALGFLLLSWWEAGSMAALSQTVIQELQVTSVFSAGIYMAVFGSIIGLTAYIKGQDGIEASEASWFTYLQPLIYIPAGILWLQESVSLLQLVALGIVSFGVYFASKRSVTTTKKAQPSRKSAKPKRSSSLRAYSWYNASSVLRAELDKDGFVLSETDALWKLTYTQTGIPRPQ